ncbi:MAG: pseudouridine synthase [Acutalibacteraceae bacterium]|nr:pseudouridine synthase [Acutalibacteraceae bacterium]
MVKIRLDKYISNQTLFSRSEIRKMIFKGQVTVNANIVTQPDFKVMETDAVCLDGQEISYQKFVYIVMNKPKGVLSASEDKNCKTVVDLLPEKYSKRNIFPAGRLDKDSTGMVLLTDDGDFAHRITSPKHHIEKSYIVTLDAPVTLEIIDGFKNGVILADGSRCKPCICETVGERVARVILTEGKYHQIKRMFGVYDVGVVELHRERMGNFCLPSTLGYGDFMEINPEILS